MVASHHRSNPGNKLVQTERLGDVVIPADRQPRDLVLDRVPGSQEDHRHPDILRTHPTHDLQTVYIRHRHVKDHQLRLELANSSQRPPTVVSAADVEPLVPQPERHQLSDVRLVIDDQNPRGILAHKSPDKRTHVAWQSNLWISCASPAGHCDHRHLSLDPRDQARSIAWPGLPPPTPPPPGLSSKTRGRRSGVESPKRRCHTVVSLSLCLGLELLEHGGVVGGCPLLEDSALIIHHEDVEQLPDDLAPVGLQGADR